MFRRRPFALLIALFALGRLAALEPAGLVYEAESICTPKDAWKLNQRGPDFWCLWTEEEQAELKRSKAASLASPTVATDRATPEEGAPPLHAVVDDLKPGLYQVYVSAPGRPLAYSLDGQEWHKYQGGELDLGLIRCPAGKFELWIDDRYANPPTSPGSGYFDYLRFIPLPAGADQVRRYAPWSGWPDNVLAQPNALRVSAMDCKLSGFEPEPERGMVLAGGPNDSFSYTVQKAGTYYLAVDMLDDADGVEDLRISLNGQEVGAIVGNGAADSQMVAALDDPLTVQAGDTLTFTTRSQVGFYRVAALVFSPTPIAPPPPAIEHLTAWSPEPGTAHILWTTSVAVTDATVKFAPADSDKPIAPTAAPEALSGPARNHGVILSGLDPKRAYVAHVSAGAGDQTITAAPLTFTPAPNGAKGFKAQTIALTVPEPTDAPRQGWLASVGVPFGQGELDTVSRLSLLTAANSPRPMQAEVFSRWPDGSVKWALVEFVADSGTDYQLSIGNELSPASAGIAKVSETAEAWQVTTDALSFRLSKRLPALFDQVTYDRNGDGKLADDERIQAAPLGANLKVEAEDGSFLTCGPPAEFKVERNGPIEALLMWRGPLVTQAGPAGWSYVIRATLTTGQPQFDLNLSLINELPEPKWEKIRTFALRVPLDTAGGIQGGFDGAPLTAVPNDDGLVLHQDLDNHYTVTGGQSGERAVGVASAVAGNQRVDVVIRDFWQTYPSGFAIKPDGVHVRLLPPLPADAYQDQPVRDQMILYSWCEGGQYIFRAGQTTQHQVTVRYGGSAAPVRLAGWVNAPLRPQVPPPYAMATKVLGRDLFVPGDGVWEQYEGFFDRGFANLLKDRDNRRSYGWMNWGDWFGEREMNWGNNEYDLPWSMGVQYLRTNNRAMFDRGEQMARHYGTVDALHAEFTDSYNGLQYEHSFNHLGAPFTASDPRIEAARMGNYMALYGGGMFNGAIDRQGHVYVGGHWLYAALTGDRWLRETADRVSANQAEKLTPNFNFGIERAGGWPLINMATAYGFSGNPYYLNAARLMIERCLQRQDPVTGGWLHQAPASEVDGEQVMGGKAFAVGILTNGILRYLEQEPEPRPDVERMLIRGADWLREESWNPDKQGYRYISRAKKYQPTGSRGATALLNAEVIAFAYEQTKDPKYLEFLHDNLQGMLAGSPSGMGKGFTMDTRQTVYGLDRAADLGMTDAPGKTIVQTRERAVIQDGQARIVVVVANPTDKDKTATLQVAGGDFTPLKWLVKAGAKTAGPALVLMKAKSMTLSLQVTLEGFGTTTKTVELLPPAPLPAAHRGQGVAYVGPAESTTLRALAASGLNLPVISEPTAANFAKYAGLMLAADCWKSPTIDIPAAAPAMVEFCRAGGRLAIWQLNDDSWDPGTLPNDLFLFDDDSVCGQVIAKDHPLFAGVGKLDGAKSYDSLGPVAAPWVVLAKDAAGQPAIVEAPLGHGRILVIEPSFDRYAAQDGDQPDDAVGAKDAQRLMQNLVKWLAE